MHSRKRYMLNQSPIYMLLYISRGGAQTGQKRGSVGNANAGTKSKCVALQN